MSNLLLLPGIYQYYLVFFRRNLLINYKFLPLIKILLNLKVMNLSLKLKQRCVCVFKLIKFRIKTPQSEKHLRQWFFCYDCRIATFRGCLLILKTIDMRKGSMTANRLIENCGGSQRYGDMSHTHWADFIYWRSCFCFFSSCSYPQVTSQHSHSINFLRGAAPLSLLPGRTPLDCPNKLSSS